MKELNEKVVMWASNKGIFHGSTALKQLDKLQEEVNELDEELFNENGEKAKDELGDCLVVLTVIAEFLGTTPEECLQRAYDKISKRKGKMVGGVFVKEEDL